MTILEAYACEKPVVASRVSSLKDLVKNGETGLLFELGDIEQLAEGILSLIRDESMARETGLKGKKFVIENFTITDVATKLEKVYKEVVDWRNRLKDLPPDLVLDQEDAKKMEYDAYRWYRDFKQRLKDLSL